MCDSNSLSIAKCLHFMGKYLAADHDHSPVGVPHAQVEARNVKSATGEGADDDENGPTVLVVRPIEMSEDFLLISMCYTESLRKTAVCEE